LSFLQLAEQGFYDGLPFYDLGGALATGDPRGDGLGDPGYRLRDEPTARRFDRPGVVVLDRSSPDAGGSRFWLTREPRPRLEARSVALGEVISGLDVLAFLGPGDRVLRLTAEAPGAAGPGSSRPR
jgi:cyclophilin family peptidyl-prolyl cis-trans isomerase